MHAVLRARSGALRAQAGRTAHARARAERQTTHASRPHDREPARASGGSESAQPRRDARVRPIPAWVADSTGVWTWQGWLSLAVVLDIYSRLVVGGAMDQHRDEALVEQAARMALARRHPEPGVLHHSDRGSQSTCQDYRALLAHCGIVVSMSRKADCSENARMERFIGTLKTECVDRESYQTRVEARHSIFEYLEVFYHRQRLHSSLGYVSPVIYEQHVK
jgi:putative transposase